MNSRSRISPDDLELPSTRRYFSSDTGGEMVRNRLISFGLLPPDEDLSRPLETTLDEDTLLAEERGLGEQMYRGGASGALNVTSGFLSGVETFTGDTALTDAAQSMVDEHLPEFIPPAEIQQELASNPRLIYNPKWLAYNLPNWVAGTLPLIVGTGGGGLLLKGAARILPQFAPATNIGRHAVGAAMNALAIGGGVYNEALEGGKSHKEAVKLAHKSMLVAAPLSAFDSVLLMGGGGIQNAIRKAKGLAVSKDVVKKYASGTRLGQTGITAGAEAGQEAAETMLAENWILDKPITSNVLEAIIGGGFVGGSFGFLRGADPAQRFANAVDNLTDQDYSESESDIDSDEDTVADELRDPAQHPARADLFDALAGVSRERIDDALIENGEVPTSDDQWSAILKKGLRAIGYGERALEGLSVRDLEQRVRVSTQRLDEVVDEPVTKMQNADLMDGDTFQFGEGEDASVFRVKTVRGGDVGDPGVFAEVVELSSGEESTLSLDDDLDVTVLTRSRFEGARSPQLELWGPPQTLPLIETDLRADEEFIIDETLEPGIVDPAQADLGFGETTAKPVSVDMPGSLSTPDMDEEVVQVAKEKATKKAEDIPSAETLDRALGGAAPTEEAVEERTPPTTVPYEEVAEDLDADVPPSEAAAEPAPAAPTPATTTQIPLQPVVPLYHQTPTDPDDIAEIYRSHPVKELLTRIGPRSSKDTARGLAQLKKDAKALDIPIAGKRSKQAIAQLIRDTVLKRDKAAEVVEDILPAPAPEAEAQPLDPTLHERISDLLLESGVTPDEIQGLTTAELATELKVVLEEIGMARAENINEDPGGPPDPNEQRFVDRVDALVAEAEAAPAPKEVVEDILPTTKPAEDAPAGPPVPISEVGRRISFTGREPEVRALVNSALGVMGIDYKGKAIQGVVATTVAAKPTYWQDGYKVTYAAVNVTDPNFEAVKGQEFDPAEFGGPRGANDMEMQPGVAIVEHRFMGTSQGVTIHLHPENAPDFMPGEQEDLSIPERYVLNITASLKSGFRAEEFRRGGISPQLLADTTLKLKERKLLNKAGAITKNGRNALEKYFPARAGSQIDTYDEFAARMTETPTARTEEEATTPAPTVQPRVIAEGVSGAGEGSLATSAVVAREPHKKTPVGNATKIDPKELEAENLEQRETTPPAKGFKRPVTGLHEKNPDDPPESFWREEVAPGVTRVQQMLDEGVEVLWRPWMTSDEKGRALVNLGFKREGKRRNELTKHRPGAILAQRSITMGFPKDIIDAYYDFLSGKKTTTAPAKPGEDTIENVIATFPETFALRAFPDDLFRVAGPPKSWIDQQGKPQIVVEVEKDGEWLDFDRDTPENVRQEIVAEQTLAETPGLQLTEEDLAGVPTPTPATTFPTTLEGMTDEQIEEEARRYYRAFDERQAASREEARRAGKDPGLAHLTHPPNYDDLNDFRDLFTGKKYEAIWTKIHMEKASGLISPTPTPTPAAAPAATPTPPTAPIEGTAYVQGAEVRLEQKSGSGILTGKSTTDEKGRAYHEVLWRNPDGTTETINRQERVLFLGEPPSAQAGLAEATDQDLERRKKSGLKKLAKSLGVPDHLIKNGHYWNSAGQRSEKPSGKYDAAVPELIFLIRNADHLDNPTIEGRTYPRPAKSKPHDKLRAKSLEAPGEGAPLPGEGLFFDAAPVAGEPQEDIPAPTDEDYAGEEGTATGEAPPSTLNVEDALAHITAAEENEDRHHDMTPQSSEAALNDPAKENIVNNAVARTDQQKADDLNLKIQRALAAAQPSEEGSAPTGVWSEWRKGDKITLEDNDPDNAGEIVLIDNYSAKVRVKGQKGLRSIPKDQIELVGSGEFRLKAPRTGVSDQTIAEARAFIGSVKSIIGKFKGAGPGTARDNMIRFAKTLGIKIDSRDQNPDIEKKIRRRLAPARGERRQEPTDKGDVLEGILRKMGTVTAIEGGVSRRIVHQSGWLLKDGTYVAMESYHYDHAEDVYGQAWSQSFDIEVPKSNEDATLMLQRDTGAIQVSIDKGLGGAGVVYHGSSTPSSAQITAMSSAAKRGEFLYYTLNLTDQRTSEFAVENKGPMAISNMLRNFWFRATSDLHGFRQDVERFGDMGPADIPSPSRYPDEMLEPFDDPRAESIAQWVAKFAPDTDFPAAYAREWVLSYDSVDEAGQAMFEVWVGSGVVNFTAEEARALELHKEPTEIKRVIEAAKSGAEVGTQQFIGTAERATRLVRDMYRNGEADKIQKITDLIKKDVNRRSPMAIAIQNAIDFLRPTRLASPGFMPHPDDAKGVSYEAPESWDVPLEDPMLESLAQLMVKLNIRGPAPAEISPGWLPRMTIGRARSHQWNQRFVASMYRAGVLRSVRNPAAYRPNGDIYARTPRMKRGKVKTLLNVIPALVSKGPVKWLRARVQTKNPLEDIAVAGQYIRDPRVENFAVYYMNDENVIVGHEIMTSGLPNAVRGKDLDIFEYISARAGALGATKIASAHNHPIGWPSPSESDIEAHKYDIQEARKYGLEHLGHVIVNDSAYATLTERTLDESVQVRLEALDPAIGGKVLRRGAYDDKLTTPGLEEDAAGAALTADHMASGAGVDTTVRLRFERQRAVRGRLAAGLELSPEDRASHMSSITTAREAVFLEEGEVSPWRPGLRDKGGIEVPKPKPVTNPRELDIVQPIGGVDEVQAQILDHATRMAHEEEGVVFVYSDAAGRITSVQVADIELLRGGDEFVSYVIEKEKAATNAYSLNVYATEAAAAMPSRSGNGLDRTVEGHLARLRNSGHIDGFAVQEQFVSGQKKPDVPAVEGRSGFSTDFRVIFDEALEEDKELVLFALGMSPGIRKSDMNGRKGMWYLANQNRKWLDEYRSHGNERLIKHFLKMGVDKGIDFDMLAMLEPGEDPANPPWQAMSERATINRRTKPRTGGRGFAEDPSIFKEGGRRIAKLIDQTRGHEEIPMDESTPNLNKFRRHFMGGADQSNKWTAPEETLVNPEVMEDRLFQTFEITDLKGLVRELGSVIKNIGSGVGIKKSVLAGIKRIKPFMAKWLYDTEHAITVWTDIVNEHRLTRGGEALDITKNPRNAVDLARQVGGRIEAKIKEYNAILKIYGQRLRGKQLGLTDQEMLEVTLYQSAKQALRRVSVARGRYEKLQSIRRELIKQRQYRTALSGALRDRNITVDQREQMEASLDSIREYIKDLMRDASLLEKITVERKNENGDVVFDEALINPGHVTGAEAEAALEELREKVGGEQWAKLEELEREMNQFWNGMLDISHDAGLISRQDMVQMKEANHHHGNYMSPFDIVRHYNESANSGGGGPASRGGISVFDHKLYESMVGSNSDSRDPMIASVDKISAVISFAARNKAMKTFHDSRLLWEGAEIEVEHEGEMVAARVGDEIAGGEIVDPDLGSVMVELEPGEDIPDGYRKVHYFRDGKRISFAVYEPIADALLGANRPVAGSVMRSVRFFTKWLRAGATALSPSFIAINIPRDLMTQYVVADNPLRPGSWSDIKLLWNSLGAALKASYNPETIDPILQEFMAMGAGYGGQVQSEMTGAFTDPESDRLTKKRMDASRRKVFGRDIEDPSGVADKVLGIGSNIMNAINPFGSGMSVSESMEQGVRFAVFQKQLQAQGVEVSVAGLEKATEAERTSAIFAGRRSTVDFSRGGRMFLFANMIAPFTNAAVQGVRTTASGIIKHPGRAAFFMGLGVLTEITLSIMNRMNFGDMLDEEEDWLRRKNFTMIVGTWEDDNGEEHPISLHFPKGDLISAAAVPFTDFMDHLWKAKTDPNVALTDNAVGGMFDTMVEMFSEMSPIEFTRGGTLDVGLVASRFLPVPFRATLEVMTDRNFYFDREIEGKLKGMLTEDRIKRDTTDFAVFMSGVAGSVFDVFGDRETNPFSPVVIDHLVKGFSAEGGAIASRMAGTVASVVTDPFSPVTFGSNVSSRMFGRDVGPREWMDWLEVAAYSPVTKRFLSVRGGKQEREQMESLNIARQIMGSRRAHLIRPVRALVLNRTKMTRGEFAEVASGFTPEQIDMLKVELDREAHGLGPSQSVARTLRSMSVRWGRAVGIVEIMNRNITNPVDRMRFLQTLAYSNLLTPTVIAQVMLLAGNNALRRPGRILPGRPGLAPVSHPPSAVSFPGDLSILSEPERLPFFPDPRQARRSALTSR